MVRRGGEVNTGYPCSLTGSLTSVGSCSVSTEQITWLDEKLRGSVIRLQHQANHLTGGITCLHLGQDERLIGLAIRLSTKRITWLVILPPLHLEQDERLIGLAIRLQHQANHLASDITTPAPRTGRETDRFSDSPPAPSESPGW
ncbi:hypothetical protein J6590_031223 [Homalodisca vitripennis]|nr:hypothetical protein J6590_031223 [Homalodisca vitripennis]